MNSSGSFFYTILFLILSRNLCVEEDFFILKPKYALGFLRILKPKENQTIG
ncbi:hypothetical protein P872_25040 [Rhodonellum psychrophilum GCM71 = DSM 17998]|uniref:Uncharacterized protein n=1 Tax=Rhodonellum psychrophilum GCM71 = DSM 17998 TaxID=1123057 RepID=U5C669_9BACT|nr:hypothetical protein P872_25040 [Rhodonellum psychrophilum GCM71 = DSM 17998]